MSDTRIKLFAVASLGLAKNLGGFAKDLWSTQKGNVKRAGKIGLSFGAMGYAGNRITTSLKDHNEGNDGENKKFLGKALATGAAIGATALAAKHGKLGSTPIKSLGGKTGSEAILGGMKKVGKAVNPIQLKKDPKARFGYSGIGNTALNAGFIAMPVVGYLGQKKQQDDQAKQTEKNYSENDEKKSGVGGKLLKTGATLAGTGLAFTLARKGKFGAGTQRFIGNATAQLGGTLKAAGANKVGDKLARSGSQTYAQGFRMGGKDPRFAGKAVGESTQQKIANAKYIKATDPNKISSGINRTTSFFGFYGKGGTKAVQNTANKLANSGKTVLDKNGNPVQMAGSGSEISRKVGEFMQKHKTTANVGAGLGSLAVGTTIMGAAAKPFKVLDKRAYEYEEQQNKQVE
jgi:hypothetical protein